MEKLKLTFLLLSAITMLCVRNTFAQEVVFVNAPREAWPKKGLEIGIEERFRVENLNNFNFLGYGHSIQTGKRNDTIFLNRIRIGFNFTPSDRIRFSMWGYQADVWDFSIPMSVFKNPIWKQKDQPFKERNEIYKAYVELKVNDNLKIKLGRQRMDYGDFRTFGLCNWTNTGPYLWDALKVSYNFKNGDFVDIFVGRTKINDPSRFSFNHRHGFNGIGLYSSLALPLIKSRLEPFFAYKGDDTKKYRGEKGKLGRLNERYVGFRLWGRDIHGFDYDLWFSREFGKHGPDSIEAYAYHILLGYNLKNLWGRPRISAEFTYSSGDDDPEDGRHKTYDVAYGVWGSWYGNQWSFFRWRNFEDLQMNLEIWPKKHIHIVFSSHTYWLSQKEDKWYLNPALYSGGPGRGKKVGETFDATATFNLGRLLNVKALTGHHISITLGHFIASDVPRIRAKDSSPANWFYLEWRWNWKKQL